MNRDYPLPSDANNLNRQVTKKELTRVKDGGRRGTKTTTWNLAHGGKGVKTKSFDGTGNKTVVTTRVNRHGDEKVVTKKYKRKTKSIYNIPVQELQSRRVSRTPSTKVIKAKY
jgi:MinD-like ATPase involved in chromosome partitioning or flagellar assembly